MFEKNAEVVLCAMERRAPSHENCFRWPRLIHSSIYTIYNVRGALCLSRIVSMVSTVSMVYYVVPHIVMMTIGIYSARNKKK